MPRYIDADKLKQKMWDYYELAYLHDDVERCDAMMSAIQMLQSAKIVDTKEVKRGRWEMKPDPYGFFDKIPVCSACGCMTKFREKYAYCPNCGAKMDGDSNA